MLTFADLEAQIITEGAFSVCATSSYSKVRSPPHCCFAALSDICTFDGNGYFNEREKQERERKSRGISSFKTYTTKRVKKWFPHQKVNIRKILNDGERRTTDD